jgi:hypothetical protein
VGLATRGRTPPLEFQNALDREYQAYAGKPSTLEEVQKIFPASAALIGWLDTERHHWACVVRDEGDPLWVQFTGSGQDGAWTKGDEDRPRALRAALAAINPPGERPRRP